jgi:hypothetical protein
MSPYSKKRAAEDSEDDEKITAKASKKSKQGIVADGEDDEGNPFWDVCVAAPSFFGILTFVEN